MNTSELLKLNIKPKSKTGTLRLFHPFIWKSLTLGLILWLSLGAPVQAATFTVTKTADTADGSCDADCSLREAIIAANASTGADTITLPAGTYLLSIVGIDEDASATGDLDITDDLTITGTSEASTIIDGAEIDRVFDVDPAGAGVIVNISQVTISNGNAPYYPDAIIESGGGIDNGGTLTLTNVTVSENKALDIPSLGGLHNLGTMYLTNVTVSGNTGYHGGGIGNEGILNLDNCEISGNAATGNIGSGGGIYNKGTLHLTNSTVSGNTARDDGGGIYNINVAAFASVTIANNQATTGQGGGIYNRVEIQIETTLLADNFASGIANNCMVPIGGNFTDFGYNLEDADSCGFTGTGDIINTDPLLGPLKDNGGPTYTHALLVGSPAIDGGNPNGCTDVDGVTELTTDQRGYARSVDGNRDSIPICDIGAYEYVPSKAMPWIPLLLGD